MSSNTPLPAIITCGEAGERAKVTVTAIHDWIKIEPSLVAYETPLGRLLFKDRFETFLAKRGPRPPKTRPRSRAVGEGGQ
jgi:hypothetical protein